MLHSLFIFLDFLYGDSVKETWNLILQLYRDYTGTGMIAGLFIASTAGLVYLEKQKDRRVLMVLLPITVFAIFMFPLFAWVVIQYAETEIYYRILWLLPVTAVIAYVGAKLASGLKGWRRLGAVGVLVAIICFCGDYVYDNPYFTKAENTFHVPNTVIELCDGMILPDREVRAVVPVDMVQYVRQYTPYVQLAFGRDVTVDRWNLSNEMYEIYELGYPNGMTEASLLADACRKYDVHYVVWDADKEMFGSLIDYDFVLLYSVGKYDVFADAKSNLEIDFSKY